MKLNPPVDTKVRFLGRCHVGGAAPRDRLWSGGQGRPARAKTRVIGLVPNIARYPRS